MSAPLSTLIGRTPRSFRSHIWWTARQPQRKGFWPVVNCRSPDLIAPIVAGTRSKPPPMTLPLRRIPASRHHREGDRDRVEAKGSPWGNLLQAAIFDGKIDDAIAAAQQKMKEIAGKQ